MLKNQVPGLLGNTFILIFGTFLLVTVISLIAALLLEFSDIKFKAFWEKAVILPLAFPIYVLAYVYVASLQWSSPAMSFLRDNNIALLKHFNIKGTFGAIFVFSIALFPYVLIPLRKELRELKGELYWSALTLAKSKSKVFWKLVFPLLKKPIFIGGALVLLEVLADFGAVSVFNYDTFTTAIYTSWTGFFSYPVGARLSLILISFSFLILFIMDKYSPKQLEGYQCTQFYAIPFKLTKIQHISSQAFLFFLLTVCFLFPSFQLLKWSTHSFYEFDFSTIKVLLANSVILAILVSLAGVILAMCLVFWSRRSVKIPLQTKISLMGYGIPGTVIAVAIYVFFVKTLSLSPTYSTLLVALVFGLLYRFLILPFRLISFESEKISKNIEACSLTLKQPLSKYLRKIWVPLLRPSLKFAYLILFIEVVKEMPLTLILRPIGFDTLSTKVYELTSEGEWLRAAIPSLMIVILSLFVTFLFFRKREVDYVKN